MPGDSWSDADIIDIYTRRQAIEDGVLVQLSGPGYQGDPWMPAMVAEAGFRYPVAMTTTAFCRHVSPLDGDDEKLAPCQDIKGRLWDVLSRHRSRNAAGRACQRHARAELEPGLLPGRWRRLHGQVRRKPPVLRTCSR